MYLPLIEEIINPPSILQAFERFKDQPYCFFLDSSMKEKRLGRFSFVGYAPFLLLKSRGQEITLRSQQGTLFYIGNPFDTLGELLDKYHIDNMHPILPFVGGAVGYLSYDLGHFIERLPSNAIDDLQLPECYLAFYDSIIIFDHIENRMYVSSTGFPEKGDSRKIKSESRMAELQLMLSQASNIREKKENLVKHSPNDPIGMRSNFTHDGYIEGIKAAREYIRAGDIFQVNLSQRFEVDMPLPACELYKRLRGINPAPFAAYLNFNEVSIVSTSPERFLKVRGDLVETRPIKGTRPRGIDFTSDQALAQELIHSSKDQAEHIMIVDLERNDLGRVCGYGSVKVSELMALEQYATVYHLTSTIQGRLRQGRSIIDLLKATFPGGSITGAPKIRAMEIIDELEPTKRSVYTGSIGYISFDGNADLNIVIRTILVKDGVAYFQVGGGIVFDSDPEGEYKETLYKAKALIQALRAVPELITEVKR